MIGWSVIVTRLKPCPSNSTGDSTPKSLIGLTYTLQAADWTEVDVGRVFLHPRLVNCVGSDKVVSGRPRRREMFLRVRILIVY